MVLNNETSIHQRSLGESQCFQLHIDLFKGAVDGEEQNRIKKTGSSCMLNEVTLVVYFRASEVA